MKLFKNKWFAKFARKAGITDKKLLQAIREVKAGNVDADYGGGVIKQRIARQKEGKSGGYRTIILITKGEKAFFVFGFAKSELDNIDRSDVRGFKKLAKIMGALTDDQIESLKEKGEIEEIRP
ncbi:MAG TPA: type II toxin-antitoxin system RelE/ParE family toxin [Pyrinomonadaceae bacterium]|nr:type II toxin-antitoxin system RelE/ParE family toxin [Pyrinomonadaceae bacterium]HMP65439.1 type II toxin-antitoxin system RelE/ParE family toxin [Pyrinomonadaceae bacterium]